MVSLTFWLAGLAVDGPASLKLIECGGVPVNAVGLIIRQDVKKSAWGAWARCQAPPPAAQCADFAEGHGPDIGRAATAFVPRDPRRKIR